MTFSRSYQGSATHTKVEVKIIPIERAIKYESRGYLLQGYHFQCFLQFRMRRAAEVLDLEAKAGESRKPPTIGDLDGSMWWQTSAKV